MSFVTITQAEAEEYFKEALDALGWCVNQSVPANKVIETQDDPRSSQGPFDLAEVQKIVRGLTLALFNSIRIFVFVDPYERYKKACALAGILNPPDMASLAFAADTRASQTALVA